MYKVIIDTNILINATQDDFSYAWQVIDLVIQGKVMAVASDKILKENRLIIDQLIVNQKDKNKLEDFLSRVEVVKVNKKIKIIKDDPEDDKFIECAHQTKADFIISNDAHLLHLENYNQTQIIDAKEFWYIYSGEEKDEWKEVFRDVLQMSS